MKLNGRTVDLESLVADGISQAETFALGRVDLERIAAQPVEAQATLRRLLVVRRIVRDATGFECRLEDMHPDDILGSVKTLVARHNKGAGLRSLKAKYGHDGAERIVSRHVGHQVSLR